MDVPVIEAGEERPYLCLMVDPDMTVLSDLILRYPADEKGGAPDAGIQLGETTSELLDAAAWLASLLDAPGDIAEVAPLTGREILYRLLIASGGATLRQMVRAGSRLSQIAKAIVRLRSHYAEACRIDDMADIADMSRSTFHAHFKAVMAMSPLEFRTHLRLHQARRLMVAEALDAAGAGYRVGYESPSQFSRDYVRLFGLPPARDASRLRGSAWAPGQQSDALAAQA